MFGLPKGGDDGDNKAKSTAFCKGIPGSKARGLPSGYEIYPRVLSLISSSSAIYPCSTSSTEFCIVFHWPAAIDSRVRIIAILNFSFRMNIVFSDTFISYTDRVLCMQQSQTLEVVCRTIIFPSASSLQFPEMNGCLAKPDHYRLQNPFFIIVVFYSIIIDVIIIVVLLQHGHLRLIQQQQLGVALDLAYIPPSFFSFEECCWRRTQHNSLILMHTPAKPTSKDDIMA